MNVTVIHCVQARDGSILLVEREQLHNGHSAQQVALLPPGDASPLRPTAIPATTATSGRRAAARTIPTASVTAPRWLQHLLRLEFSFKAPGH